MRLNQVAISLTLLCAVGSESVDAQVADTNDLFAVAYKAIEGKLPPGARVIVNDDPLLRESAPEAEPVRYQRNHAFADANGLANAPLKDLMACEYSAKCSFTREGVGALVSFKLATTTSNDAVVQVSTRYREKPGNRSAADTLPLRIFFVVYDLHIVRGKSGKLSVAKISVSSES